MKKTKVTKLDDHRPEVYESLDTDQKRRVLRIEQEIQDRMIDIKVNVYEIGKLLSKAREIVGHGNFQLWVKQTFNGELPYSTAAFFKGVYETFKDRSDVVRLLPIY
jgi:hypothetical protein